MFKKSKELDKLKQIANATNFIKVIKLPGNSNGVFQENKLYLLDLKKMVIVDDNGKIKKYIPKYWELCDDNKLHEQIENLKYDFAVTVVAMAKCVDAAMEIDQTPVYPRSRIPLSDGQPVIGISGKTLNEQSGYFKIYENKGVILYVIDVIDGENVTVDEYGNALYAPANYWSPVLSIPTLMCSDNQATSYE